VRRDLVHIFREARLAVGVIPQLPNLDDRSGDRRRPLSPGNRCYLRSNARSSQCQQSSLQSQLAGEVLVQPGRSRCRSLAASREQARAW